MKNPNWPAYVNLANGRVVYRPRVKGEPPEGYGIDSSGFLKPPVKLGKPTDTDDQILKRYLEARLILSSSEPKQTFSKNSLFWIKNEYLSSQKFKTLSPSSQNWYTVHLDVFLGTKIFHPNGHKVTLGSIDVSYLTLPGINRIRARLMKESEEKGATGTSYINGHIRSARAMMTWALNNIDGLGIQLIRFGE